VEIPDATKTRLPADGMTDAAVLAEVDARQSREPDVHGARLFGLVYPTGRHDLEELIAAVNRRYLFGNALNPFKFPEIARFEGEVIAVLLSNNDLVGACKGRVVSAATGSSLIPIISWQHSSVLLHWNQQSGYRRYECNDQPRFRRTRSD